MSPQGTITLVPSVHFSPTHRRRVRHTIREQDPDIVAVELGERRFERLEGDSRLGTEELAAELPPATAATYRTLATIQRSAVRLFGLDPGKTDMETAVDTAADLDSQVALIDEPVTQVFAALRARVGVETIPKVLLRAQFAGSIGRLTRVRVMTVPVRRVEDGDDVQPMIDYLEQLIPEVTEVLIDRRDRIMAERLHTLRREGNDVVAVIGAGHHNGIRRRLDELEARESDLDATVPIRSPSKRVTEIPIE